MTAYNLLLLLFSIASTCCAQTEIDFSGSSSTIASRGTQTHTITVGKIRHRQQNDRYSPDSIEAAINDVIEFQFFPPNHSVARADYGWPCVPYELTGSNRTGFWSGFYPIPKVIEDPPSWNLTINDTNPIFFYCAAPESCIKGGMVGVINPNSSMMLETQKQDALNSKYSRAPGENLPTEEIPPSQTIGQKTASATATDASMTGLDMTSGRHLSPGAIAGIVIGGVAMVVMIGPLLFYLGRNRTELEFLRRDIHKQSRQQSAPDVKVSHTEYAPTTPTLRYGPDDPRIGEQMNEDAPPYSTYAVTPITGMAELDSTAMISIHASPAMMNESERFQHELSGSGTDR